MKQYHTVIFDLDGTLLNTLEDLTDSINWAMQKYGYPLHTIDEVRSFVGNGLQILRSGRMKPTVSRKLMAKAVAQKRSQEVCSIVSELFGMPFGAW